MRLREYLDLAYVLWLEEIRTDWLPAATGTYVGAALSGNRPDFPTWAETKDKFNAMLLDETVAGGHESLQGQDLMLHLLGFK